MDTPSTIELKYDEKPKVIVDAYLDPEIGFCGAAALHKKLSLLYSNIERKDVETVLKSIQSHQQNRPVVKSKVVKPIVVKHAYSIFQVDLVDFQKLASFNDGYNWLMNIIDLHSKFAYSIPLKNKTTDEVVANIEALLLDIAEKAMVPAVIQTDNGSEFISNEAESMFERLGIKHLTSLSHTPQSQGAVERFNRTLKQKLYRYWLQENSKNKRWVDVLPKLVENYNNTYHSTTKKTPAEAHQLENTDLAAEIHSNIRVKADKMIEKDVRQLPEIKVGDYVRLSLLTNADERAKGKFRKSVKNWSDEVYIVDSIGSKKGKDSDLYGVGIYKLKRETGEVLPSIYRRWQLLPSEAQENVVKVKEKPMVNIERAGRTIEVEEKHADNPAVEPQVLPDIAEDVKRAPRIRKPNTMLKDFVWGKIS
jgi:hypothetical protein